MFHEIKFFPVFHTNLFQNPDGGSIFFIPARRSVLMPPDGSHSPGYTERFRWHSPAPSSGGKPEADICHPVPECILLPHQPIQMGNALSIGFFSSTAQLP